MRSCLISLLCLSFASLALGPTAAAADDKLSAGGYFFSGSLKSIEDDQASFEIGTTGNTISLDTGSLEGLETEKPRLILYGEVGTITGRILGYADGAIRVENAAGESRTIALDNIVSLGDPADNSFSAWSQDRMRYWSGNLDISVAASQATVDTTQVLFGLGARRKTDDTQFGLSMSYRYGTRQEAGASKETDLDEAIFTLNARRTVWDDLFVFGDMKATYDAIQFLSLRTQPVVGVGYDILKLDQGALSTKLGYGWIYESFFGGDNTNFSTLAIGLATNWKLPFKSTLEASFDYLPPLEDFMHGYLVQAKATYSVPILSYLSFKLQISNNYDDAPAADASRNSLSFNIGLSITL
ncbi:MAG: DUF481 domain-containing protein [Deltaproteobacteria bacterium]